MVLGEHIGDGRTAFIFEFKRLTLKLQHTKQVKTPILFIHEERSSVLRFSALPLPA